VALVKTAVSEEHIASIIKMKRTSELGLNETNAVADGYMVAVHEL
jgi:hypothetical protein